MQGDANFVVYTKKNHPIWASNTHGKGAGHIHLICQADGNLVLYNPNMPGHNQNPIWASNTHGMDSNPTLVLMNNGNLALFGQSTTQLWSSNSHQQKKQKKEKKDSSSSSDSSSDEDDHAKNITFWCRKRDRLFEGSRLDIGEQLISRNGVFNAIMQGDGNFVVYHNGNKPIWASNTHGLHGNLHVIM